MNKQPIHSAATIAPNKVTVICMVGMLVMSMGLASGCSEKKPALAASPQAMPVTVVAVQPTDVPLTGEWVGTLDGNVNAQIQPQATVAAAEAAVENAQLNLGFTQVRSLITGVAGQATTQVGNLVNTQSVLTSVSQLNPIRAYFSISDSEYLRLTQRARQGGGDLLKDASVLPLTLTLSNGALFPLKGHIAFVDRQMNSQTGAIRIAAAFPNPGNVLRPGQFGRVKADTDIRHGALLIPQVAVQEFQGLHQVYVAGSDGKAHVATVQLGAQVGTNWLVESGVGPGALVIIDNLQKLGEGAPVKQHQGPAVAPTDPANNSAGRESMSKFFIRPPIVRIAIAILTVIDGLRTMMTL